MNAYHWLLPLGDLTNVYLIGMKGEGESVYALTDDVRHRLLVAADWFEELGDPTLAPALRWMSDQHQIPYQRGSEGWYWFNTAFHSTNGYMGGTSCNELPQTLFARLHQPNGKNLCSPYSSAAGWNDVLKCVEALRDALDRCPRLEDGSPDVLSKEGLNLHDSGTDYEGDNAFGDPGDDDDYDP